jgi:hypothetical protein
MVQEKSMSHKYRLQQLIRLVHPVSDGRVKSNGIYEVTRLMPADQTGMVSYRVKASGFGERAVREFEIAGPATATA